MGVDPDVFAAAYWSRRPLLTSAADLGRDFSDLLTLADVDELLSVRGLRTPSSGSPRTAPSWSPGGSPAPAGPVPRWPTRCPRTPCSGCSARARPSSCRACTGSGRR
ncbi:hypothetical protein ACFQX8_05205 [Klenkia terrae]|uniref:hypothetical protein n=1 Tax=Klenkia terrae TaxID=1052259 RepID=UPI00360E3CAD